MPSLYIRDEKVNELADTLAALTGLKKTAAVRAALESHIDTLQSRETLRHRLEKLQARVKNQGWSGAPFDDKALMDELSGGI